MPEKMLSIQRHQKTLPQVLEYRGLKIFKTKIKLNVEIEKSKYFHVGLPLEEVSFSFLFEVTM